MKPYFKTLLLVYTSLFIGLNLVQCSSLGKVAPEHRGVDPAVAHFVKEFKELAAMQGITFKHDVSIGFKKLNGSTVGLTTYGPFGSWREIDLSPDYWERSTETTKFTLFMHEAAHAFCTRPHDFGAGIPYPERSDWNGKVPTEGRYQDGTGCPLSLMFPVVVSDFCVLTHFSDYVVEIFNRCSVY